MTALEVFDYGNWSVRTVVIDGEPWFVAADVCSALGYVNGRKAVGDHVDELDKGVTPCDTPGGRQNLTVVNESGLFDLIFGSTLKQARAFRHWVTSDVLPTLRRTGTYSLAPAAPAVPALPATYADALRELADRVDQLQQVTDHVERITPAADAWAQLEAGGDDMDVRAAAQWLSTDPAISIGQQRLMRLLRSQGWIDAKNVPYQQHIDNGRMHCKPSRYTDREGTTHTRYTPRVTVKGVRDLHRLLGGTRTAPALFALPGLGGAS